VNPLKPETEDDVVSIARRHEGRYLIPRSSWLDRDDEWALCNRLVEAGRARWLAHKRPGEDGEPGPGIQLTGPEAI
jgi:hypothetical protein